MKMVPYDFIIGCVPAVEALKKKILDDVRNTLYSVHPGGNKLYKDLKQAFWWSNMTQEVAEYVAKCLYEARYGRKCRTPLYW